MNMEHMGTYRRMYPAPAMHTYRGQAQQGHQFSALWSQAQILALYQQNPQRATAILMGHSAMYTSKQTEPKPRLAKDEVDALEREFAKNQKPNSSTKRDLAVKMGVEVPRINNWFQNRRAKEKQMKKAREFEAQQVKDRGCVESKSDSDGGNQSSDTEGLDKNDDRVSLALSSALIAGGATVKREEIDKDNDGDDNDRGGVRAIAHHHLDTGDYLQDQMVDSIPATNEMPSPHGSDSDGFVHVDMTSMIPHTHIDTDTLDSAPFHGLEPLTTTPMHAGFHSPLAYSFEPADQSQRQGFVPSPDLEAPPTVHADVLGEPVMFESMEEAMSAMSNTDYYGVSHVASFPSQMLPDPTTSAFHPAEAEMMPIQGPDSTVKIEDLSPASLSASPPSTGHYMRFKSPPPPTDIAGRRNMRRPAPLGLSALRSSSHGHGIRTAIDSPRRSDAPSPMRRIVSATGMSGRIQKPLLTTGPRSPFLLERNREALLQSIHQSACSPILNTCNSAMPSLASDRRSLQGLPETTACTTGSEEEQAYTFDPLATAFFKAEQAIKTPPGTPGLPLRFHEPMYPHALDQAWAFAPPDEALPTPSLCSHGSELDFSMAPPLPGYIASQPVTPSFPSAAAIGPAYGGFFGHGLASGSEHTFPDAYQAEAEARSPPSQPKAKQFQFAQNVTPQDFTTEK